MKKIMSLIAVCVVLSASAWAQRGFGRGGMGMGPGPMGRGPAAGMMPDRPAPWEDQIPQAQPQPAPEMNRPNANAQRFQNIPPAVRDWLQNGGLAILRQRFAQRAQQGQGLGAALRQGRPMGPGMGMGARGMDRPAMGPAMRGQGLMAPQMQPARCPRCQGQCDCPCCRAGIGRPGPRQGRGQMGPMAGMGGMGMMRGFGAPGQDQPKDLMKIRPFEGPKEKGDKANSPEARFQKQRNDKENKARMDKGPKPKKEKDADDEEDEDR